MPIAMERDLRKAARKLARTGKLKKKGMNLDDAEDAYVFGTMRDIEEKHRAKGGAPGKYMKQV